MHAWPTFLQWFQACLPFHSTDLAARAQILPLIFVRWLCSHEDQEYVFAHVHSCICCAQKVPFSSMLAQSQILNEHESIVAGQYVAGSSNKFITASKFRRWQSSPVYIRLCNVMELPQDTQAASAATNSELHDHA